MQFDEQINEDSDSIAASLSSSIENSPSLSGANDHPSPVASEASSFELIEELPEQDAETVLQAAYSVVQRCAPSSHQYMLDRFERILPGSIHGQLSQIIDRSSQRDVSNGTLNNPGITEHQ